RMENWLSHRLTDAALEGADPNEVSQDLRAHVHEELARPGATSVDLQTLEPILSAMDRPPKEARFRTTPWTARPPGKPKPVGFRFPKWFLFFGVIWPAITLLG